MNNKILYTLDTKGKIRYWKAYSDFKLNNDNKITITIEYGLLGSERFIVKNRYVVSGKNIGKTNETTIQEQAELEIGYLYQKQFDDGYVENIEDYIEPQRPQLAHKYNDKKHTVKWASLKDAGVMKNLYYASRKLNGARGFIFLRNGKVDRFESRTGKPFKYFKHIADDLIDYNYQVDTDLSISEVILDGELFNKNIPFEILCSLINSDEYVEVLDTETGKLWSTNDVQFHCYDIVPLTKEPLNFYDRFVDYFGLPTSSNIIRVDSEAVESEEAMVVLAKEWIKDGYEGLMLRYGASFYDFGKRSNNLLKFKIMEDEEFKIKDIYLAENDDQKVMFVLHNHHGEKDSNYSSFDCFMKGDKEINLKYFKFKDQYINKWLTVQYQTLSKYNVPLFPVGIVIREGVEENGKFVPSK